MQLSVAVLACLVVWRRPEKCSPSADIHCRLPAGDNITIQQTCFYKLLFFNEAVFEHNYSFNIHLVEIAPPKYTCSAVGVLRRHVYSAPLDASLWQGVFHFLTIIGRLPK